MRYNRIEFFKEMSTTARSIRIEDEIWKSALEKSKKMGVSLTFVIKNYLKNFSNMKDPIIVIDEGEVPLSSDLQKKADDLGTLASQKIKQRLSLQK